MVILHFGILTQYIQICKSLLADACYGNLWW